jgi:hypothetical protein
LNYVGVYSYLPKIILAILTSTTKEMSAGTELDSQEFTTEKSFFFTVNRGGGSPPVYFIDCGSQVARLQKQGFTGGVINLLETRNEQCRGILQRKEKKEIEIIPGVDKARKGKNREAILSRKTRQATPH